MEDFSIFIIVLLVSLIIITAVKLYKEIKYLREERKSLKNTYEYFYKENKK